MPAPTNGQSTAPIPTANDDLDLSAGLVPKQQPDDGIDLSAGLVPKGPASQPGAFQTRKGGPILNANSPTAAPSRTDQVAGVQTAIHAIAPAFQGGEATAGVVKGVYQTGLGGASLFAKALNKIGIRGEEIDALAKGDVSPFSEAMITPEGAGQHIGTTAEEVGEWLAGEEGIKAIQGLARLPQAGKLIKSLLNIGKAATLGAAQGGVKGAAKGDAVGGAEGGALGGAIGGTAGEAIAAAPKVIKPLLEKVGIGRTAAEDMSVAARPGKRNYNFSNDFITSAPRMDKELANKSVDSLEDVADAAKTAMENLWSNEVAPAIAKHADEPLDTKPIADLIRSRITRTMKKYGPEHAQAIEAMAKKFGTTAMTVGEVEEDLQHLNADLTESGFYKKSAAEKEAARKVNGEITSKDAASQGIRDALYRHLEQAGEGDIKGLKQTYGALKNVEGELRGQVNVSGRQVPVSLKQMIGITTGAAHGGPLGAAAAAMPFIDKWYNAPEKVAVRAVKKAVQPASTGPTVEDIAAGVGKRAGLVGAQIGESQTATGPNGHQIYRSPDGATWIDSGTGKPVGNDNAEQ